jgi:peptide deformylase
VGINRRIVAVQRFDKNGEPFEVYPNIHIDTMMGPRVCGPEGCLSVPDRRGIVPRYREIVISWKDPATLQGMRDTVRGFTAVIFQHECDHLDGILYTDRADSVFVR